MSLQDIGPLGYDVGTAGGGDIDSYLPAGFSAKVQLPQGPLGAPAGSPTVDGPLQGNHSNLFVNVPSGISGSHVLQNGTYTNITVINDSRNAINSYAKNATLVSCVLLDVTGDALKSGADDVTTATDCVMTMAPDGLSGFGDGAKHYDGAQAHSNGRIVMSRCFINWNAIGTTNQTTGAMFTQDSASLSASHVTVVNPGGTRSTCRMYGAGSHALSNWHFWGTREINQNWGNLWPRECVIARVGVDEFATLYNDVPGCADWRVD